MDLMNNLHNQNQNVFKNQYAIIRGTSLVTMVNTMTLAFTWIAMDQFKNDPRIKFTETLKSDLLTSIPLGAALGSFCSPIILHYAGRRHTIVFLSLFSAFSWAAMASDSNTLLILKSRFMQGVTLGIQSTAAAVYAGETVLGQYKPLAHIGRTSCGGAGILLMIASRYYFGFDWKELAKIIVLISLAAGFNFLFLPFSPYRMYRIYGRNECLRSLRWILQEQNSCERQFTELRNICIREEHRQVKVIDVFRNCFANTIGLFLIVMQQLTGVIIIRFHSEALFSRIIENINPATCVALLGASDALFYMFSALPHRYTLESIINNTNRFFPKVLIVLGLYFAFIDIIGFENYMKYTSGVLSSYALVFIAGFTGAYNLGWGKVSEEYLVNNLGVVQKHVACGIILATKWAMSYFLCISFPYLFHKVGFGIIFLILAVLYSTIFKYLGQNITDMNIQRVVDLY